MAKRRRFHRRVRLGASDESHLKRATELLTTLEYDLNGFEKQLEHDNCRLARQKLSYANWKLGVLDGHLDGFKAPPHVLKRASASNDRLMDLHTTFDRVCKIG